MAFHSLLSVISYHNNVLFRFALECSPCIYRILHAYSYEISYKHKINVSYARNISVNVKIAFMGIKRRGRRNTVVVVNRSAYDEHTY